MPDEPRPVATSPDQYSLTIEDALIRYEHAGHPRTVRSLQRYCAKGDLDCLRQQTTFGDRFMITPQSVARHIAQIVELASATQHGVSRPVAAPVAAQDGPALVSEHAATRPDTSRPDTTEETGLSRQVAQLEREVERLSEDRSFLRGQIATKDEQIAALLERDRETNILVRGLQQMLSPLLGGSRSERVDDTPRETRFE